MSNIVSLVQPTTSAGLSERIERLIERAYWDYDARHHGYNNLRAQSDRDAFKSAIRSMLLELRK